MPQPIGGTAYITVNGESYQLRGELMIKPGTSVKNPITGQDGHVGYSETPEAPQISGNFSDGGGVSIVDIQNMVDAVVQARLDNGKQYVLSGAFTTEAIELNTQEGQFSVVWVGDSCEERKAAA